MYSYFRFHILYCRHVLGVSKNEGERGLPVFIILGGSVPSLLYQVTFLFQLSESFLCKYIRFSVSLNNCVLFIVYSTLLTKIIRSSFKYLV